VNESDEELVARCVRSHDPAAREALVRRYLGRVRGAVSPMVFDADVADEITQDVFARVFQAIHRFNGRSQFSTWLYRIAMNATKDYWRRKKREAAVPMDMICRAIDRQAQPEARAIGAEFSRDIELALGELSPKLRAAIVLVSINGMSPAQAAEVERCTTPTMHWRLHQARKLLKQRLHQHLGSDG
jgi:RNA polymerase sigma-70 factor (ECF subfamily)